MKFKVGDLVRVREDLRYGEHYKNIFFDKDMEVFKGYNAEIAEITKTYNYRLNIDNGYSVWTDEMLEPVEVETYETYIDRTYIPKEERPTNRPKMKIILVSGKAFSGKDSTANILKEKLENQGKKVLIAHYGDLVKYTCKTFFNWNGEKDEQGRTLLQRVGTDEIRAKYPDFWVEYVKSILNVFIGEWDYVIIPDTRFPNEINVMKNTFKEVVSIRIVRTNFVSPLTEEQRNHRSETALDDYHFDYYFIADDLKQLERKVDNFLKELEDKQ